MSRIAPRRADEDLYDFTNRCIAEAAGIPATGIDFDGRRAAAMGIVRFAQSAQRAGEVFITALGPRILAAAQAAHLSGAERRAGETSGAGQSLTATPAAVSQEAESETKSVALLRSRA